MHHRALNRSRFIQDSLEQAANCGVRKRPGIHMRSPIEHLLLPVRLVERFARRLLDPPDFDNAARALIQQLDKTPVDVINFAAPVLYTHVWDAHAWGSRRLIPVTAAPLSNLTRAASAAAAASNVPARSISSTKAEPTPAASANPPSNETCPGSEMPNPIAMGSSVKRRTRRASAGNSSASWSFAPVTPVREIRYRKPLVAFAIRA